MECFDVVMAVGPGRQELAVVAIESLYKYNEFDKLYILTSAKNKGYFQQVLPDFDGLVILDEDVVIEGLSYADLDDYFVRRDVSRKRVGWYYQQFLKMSFSLYPNVNQYYLIWDADTICTNTINFFSKEKVLVNTSREHNPLYFKTINDFFGLGKELEESFITEHFMIEKMLMQELLAYMVKKGGYLAMLDGISTEDLQYSAFSEFETYGNYLMTNYPSKVECRQLKSTRKGSVYFGMKPSINDLGYMSAKAYDYVSFELWKRTKKRKRVLWWFYVKMFALKKVLHLVS